MCTENTHVQFVTYSDFLESVSSLVCPPTRGDRCRLRRPLTVRGACNALPLSPTSRQSPIQIHESPADLEGSVWLKVQRNRLVPECTRLRSRQVSVYTPQLVAERFACAIEGRSYRNNCYDSDTRDVAGSRFRREEGGVVTRNAAGLERYCESLTYVSGNRCMLQDSSIQRFPETYVNDS